MQAEYVERYGTPDQSPLDPLMFEPPAGSFFVGYLDDEAVATGAWRRSEVEVFGAGSTVEVKRMYVAPQARGRGLARVVLAHLEATAREAGAEALVLETGLKQPEAIALYEHEGWERTEVFVPYDPADGISVCFRKGLTAPVG